MVPIFILLINEWLNQSLKNWFFPIFETSIFDQLMIEKSIFTTTSRRLKWFNFQFLSPYQFQEVFLLLYWKILLWKRCICFGSCLFLLPVFMIDFSMINRWSNFWQLIVDQFFSISFWFHRFSYKTDYRSNLINHFEKIRTITYHVSHFTNNDPNAKTEWNDFKRFSHFAQFSFSQSTSDGKNWFLLDPALSAPGLLKN